MRLLLRRVLIFTARVLLMYFVIKRPNLLSMNDLLGITRTTTGAELCKINIYSADLLSFSGIEGS